MHETRHHFAVVLTVILIAVSLAGCALPPHPAAGTSAPDFTLPNQDGKPTTLSDYHGKWVVLFFYRSDISHRSSAEAHTFQNDLRKYDETHAVVLGIGPDPAASHKDFADKEQLQFPLLADPQLRVTRQYGSLTKQMIHTLVAYDIFIIDPHGKIARVLSDFDANDPSGRALSALRNLQQH